MLDKVTCALVLITPSNRTLIVHPTGSAHFQWSFPKGICEDGEEPKDAAIRETLEETGFDVAAYKDQIFDLGRYSYTKEKDIHFFCLSIPDEINTNMLKCTTYFSIDGVKEIPEVDNYRTVDVDCVERYLSRRMKETFKHILNHNLIPNF